MAKRRPLSPEHKKKISNALKEKIPKNIKMIAGMNKGKKASLETREKLSKAHLGIPAWNKGMEGYTNAGSFKLGHEKSNTGRTHFKKNHNPWNEGLFVRLNPKGEFKEGHRTWNKDIKGEESHSWKGGLTTKNQLERVKFRKEIQKIVFERDNYTCQLCGSKRNLQVDHIQPWSEYVELRFNIENCRTLCAECHYEVTFGKPMPENVKSWGHNFAIGGLNRV